MNRNKFIDKKPRPPKKSVVVEEAWLEVPKGHTLSVAVTTTEYPYLLPEGTKYRFNDRFIEALQFVDEEEPDEGPEDLYATAPFVTRLYKKHVEEDYEDDEDEDLDLGAEGRRRFG